MAVGPDRDAEPVRVFGCFTAELLRPAEFLKKCGVRTVVMQSTGVYWIPVYYVLEQAGFEDTCEKIGLRPPPANSLDRPSALE